MDRENVIKWLEETETMLTNAVERGGGVSIFEALKCLRRVTDAIVLLKEQEVTQKDGYKIVKPTKCPCGELFDAKDSSFCPKCGCAYGELSGRYTNIGR